MPNNVVTETSDDVYVFAHDSKGSRKIYSGPLSLAVHYAATYQERDSVMDADYVRAVEVVWHGNVIAIYTAKPRPIAARR